MKKLTKWLSSLLVAAIVLLSVPLTSVAAPPKTFTDDLGRVVSLPSTINTWAPSGILAQIALYSVDPAMLAGWGQAPTAAQKNYIDPAYRSLPLFGQMYGVASTPSGYDETAVINSKANIVIDVGQIKGNKTDMADDFNAFTARTGIPIVFIQAEELDDYAHIYEALGIILGDTTKTNPLKNYCTDLVDYIVAQRDKPLDIANSKYNAAYFAPDRTVYYGELDGLKTNGTSGPGAIHQNLFDFIGAINVANISSPSGAGRTPVTLSDVIKWAPDCAIFGQGSIYSTVGSDSAWSTIPAIQNSRYAEVPEALYNFIDRPPSINRLIGVQWLAYTLFPEVYPKWDTYSKLRTSVINFYNLFYHYNMTAGEANALLSKGSFESPFYVWKPLTNR